MVSEILTFSRSTPLAVALFGAHFIVYAVVAWATLVPRFFAAKMKSRELALLEAWLLLLLLELLQVAYHGGSVTSGSTLGLPRYFGVFAPILWLWLAWALARLWDFKLRANNFVRWAPKAAVVAIVAILFSTCFVRELQVVYSRLTPKDVVSAATGISRIIARDYAGPRRQTESRRTIEEYFTDRRPVVFSDYGYAARLLHGQSEGPLPNTGACPYPDDYLFFRQRTGYGDVKQVDPNVYDHVTDVKTSLGQIWRLYRRKSVPHRGMEWKR